MKFSLTNIGKIAQADIEINGLTVLGGYNDIGKSTIGKVIFSVIKTISDINQEIREAIKEQLEQEFADFYVKIRKIIGEFDLSTLRSVIISVEPDDFDKNFDVLIERLRTASISAIRKNLNRIKTTHSEDESIEIEIEKIDRLLISLQINLERILNPEQREFYEKVFNRINRSLFRGDIQNKQIPSGVKSSILIEDLSCQIKINLENNSSKDFSIDGEFPFQNVTLVDSPLVLGWSSSVEIPRSRVRNVFGHYIFDLLNKMRLSTADSYNVVSDAQQKLVSKISVVVGGQMYYDRERRDFVFQQKDMAVQLVNLASGIKTFGIIQMLLTGGMIAPNTVLIIDEPEAHLHPEWQLKYAEVLTQLVDMGVYVLVSTHSPYMIKALKHYSEKLQQEKITNFYLGNAGEHGTIFTEVTQDLNPLFKLLAMPMQRLAFED